MSNFTSSTVAGLKAWYKGDAGLTKATNNVTGWADQSGNSYDVAQLTGGNQPTQTTTLNSLPVVKFAGSQYLTKASGSVLTGNINATIIAVCKPATSVSMSVVGWGSGGSDTLFNLTCSANGVGTIGTIYSGDTTAWAVGLVTTGHQIVTITKSAGVENVTYNAYRNATLGTQSSSGSGTPNIGAGSISVGCLAASNTSQSFNGEIAEILVFDHVLSTADRDTVQSYLANKYALAGMFYMEGITSGSSTATGTLSLVAGTIAIAGEADASATATGVLQDLIATSPSAQATSTGVTQALLSTTPSGQATATGATLALLSTTASAQATATGSLQSLLGSTATASATATGVTQALLASTASAQATATAGAMAQLSAVASAQGTGALGTLALLFATASAQAVASGTLSPYVFSTTPIAGVGTASASGAGALSAPVFCSAYYAAPNDLAQYLHPRAYAVLTPGQINGILQGASAIAESYLIDQYVLPIIPDGTGAYPGDLVRAVCLIAAYDVLCARGQNPEHAMVPVIKRRRDDAEAWLQRIQRGEVTPATLVDSGGGGLRKAGARVFTSPLRQQTDSTILATQAPYAVTQGGPPPTTPYALPSDLANYMPAQTFSGTSVAQQSYLLRNASALADAYLIDQFVLPLTADHCGCYPRDLIRAVCFIAAYDLVSATGFAADVPMNTSFRDRYQESIDWLERVQRGETTPARIQDARPPGTPRKGAARVFTSGVRGVTQQTINLITPGSRPPTVPD